MMCPQESRVSILPKWGILGTFCNLCPTATRLAVMILALMPTSLLKEGEIRSRGIPILENQGYTNDRLYNGLTINTVYISLLAKLVSERGVLLCHKKTI